MRSWPHQKQEYQDCVAVPGQWITADAHHHAESGQRVLFLCAPLRYRGGRPVGRCRIQIHRLDGRGHAAAVQKKFNKIKSLNSHKKFHK